MTDDASEDGEPRALVQEADCAERVIVLKVRVPGQTSLVIVAAVRGGAGAGLVTSEGRRAAWGARLPPGSARQRPREEALARATVIAIGPCEVYIEQDGDARVVRAHGGRVVVTDAAPAKDAVAFVGASEETRDAWQTRGAALLESLALDAVEARRAEALKALERAVARIDRRREAVGSDLARIADADKLASQAQWLVAEAARAPRGARKLVVTDWSTGEGIPMEVPLDPSKSAREQVEAMFKRAKRLRLGAAIAQGRLSQADAQRRAVLASADAVRAAEALPAIDEALREAKRSAPRDVTLPEGTTGAATTAAPGAKGPKRKPASLPYRTFVGRTGRKILVGKGAKGNDALTLRVARPHDLWCHAKEHTGAHVIVMLDKRQTCPPEDLVDAAHLAAHFSDARDEKVVDVQYAERRHLRKPKESPAGFVIVDRERVLVLRVEPETLRALLEREEI